MKPIHVSHQGGQAVNILGTPMLLRIFGRDTNGTLGMAVSLDAPQSGPPPHIHHREDETFQVLEGEYEFTVAGKTISAHAGDTLFAPRGLPHGYRCVSAGGGRLAVMFTPAGFENFFAALGALTPAEQQDLPRVIELGRHYGLEFLPPPQ